MAALLIAYILIEDARSSRLALSHNPHGHIAQLFRHEPLLDVSGRRLLGIDGTIRKRPEFRPRLSSYRPVILQPMNALKFFDRIARHRALLPIDRPLVKSGVLQCLLNFSNRRFAA